MTSIQNFFHDFLQSSNNNNNDVVMLNDNDFVAINNDDVATINNDDIVPVNNNGDIFSVNKNDDKTENSITILNIDDVTLGSLKKSNATSTARSILKYLYPNPEMNFKLSNMDKVLVNAIVGKSSFFIFIIYLSWLHRLCTKSASK